MTSEKWHIFKNTETKTTCLTTANILEDMKDIKEIWEWCGQEIRSFSKSTYQCRGVACSVRLPKNS